MKLIYRYLFKDILHYFGLFILIFTAILIINETFDTRKEFVENTPAAMDVVLFLIYSIPDLMSKSLPLIGLLGTMMAYGLQAKNREILAMISAGVSFRHLAMPALIFGLFLTAFTFWFNESIAPKASEKARYIEKVVISGRSETIFTKRRNVFVKGKGSRFYYMQEYLPEKREMIYPTILDLAPDGGGLSMRVEADRAQLIDTPDGSYFWEFANAEMWAFRNGRMTYERFDQPYRLKMEEELDKFLSHTKQPEEMNVAELHEYLRLLQERGGEQIGRFSTMMHQKIAFPLTCLLMALLGFCAVLDLHARQFARGAFTGLVLAIGFYLLEATFASLGGDGFINPIVAGWAALAVFAAVVWVMIVRLEKIH